MIGIIKENAQHDKEIVKLAGSTQGNGTPLGTWMSFEGGVAPNDEWLEAGSTFNANDYPALAMLLGGTTVPERFDHNKPDKNILLEMFNSSTAISYTLLYDALVTLNADTNTYNFTITFPDGTVKIVNSGGVHSGDCGVDFVLPKGTTITGASSNYKSLAITYFKTHLFIKGVPNSSDKDLQGTLAAIKKYINDQNELSDYEQIALSTSSSNPTEMQYDGNLVVKAVGSARIMYINGIAVGTASPVGSIDASGTVEVKKGDKVYLSSYYNGCANIAYYKKRDYSNR